MGYEDQNRISKNIRLPIKSHFNTASLDVTKRGLVWKEVLRRCLGHAVSCLVASDWLVFQGGCISTSPRGSHDFDAHQRRLIRTNLVLRPGTSVFLTTDTRGLNGATVGSWPGRKPGRSYPSSFAGIQRLWYKAERMAEYITKSRSCRLLLLMKKIPLSRNWHSRRRISKPG